MSSTSLKRWQAHLAILGSIAWLGTLQVSEFFRGHNWPNLYSAISGYMIGYLTAFAGFLFWEVLQGRWRRIVYEGRVLRWISAVLLSPIFIFGFLGFVKGIWGSNAWAYSLSAFVGGIVVGKGVIPFLEAMQSD